MKIVQSIFFSFDRDGCYSIRLKFDSYFIVEAVEMDVCSLLDMLFTFLLGRYGTHPPWLDCARSASSTYLIPKLN